MIVVYATAAFVILEAVDIIFPRLNFPDWTITFVMILLVVGFPITFIFSWIFDVTPEGIEKTKPSKEIPHDEKPVTPNAWRIATYVSVVVIIGLLLVNIFSGRNGSKIDPDLTKSIAILPIHNFSGDPGQEYICDGLTDEIISNLCRIGSFSKVASLTSVLNYKNSDLNIPEIAGELDVNYILESTFKRIGDQLRVTVQLIEPAQDNHLWLHDYDRPYEEIVAIPGDIAIQIADHLDAFLTDTEKESVSELPTSSLEAYEILQRGHYNIRCHTYPYSYKDSIFKAIELDPGYADAYADMGLIILLETISYLSQPTTDQTSIWDAFNYFEKALELDPDNYLAYTFLGLASCWLEWDYIAAERYFLSALELTSTVEDINGQYLEFLVKMNRLEDALSYGLENDLTDVIMAMINIKKGHFGEANIQLNKAAEFADGNLYPYIGEIYNSWMQEYDTARYFLESAIQKKLQEMDLPRFQACLALVYQHTDDAWKVREIVEDLKARSHALEPGSPDYFLGWYYSGIGEVDSAFYYLERAYRNRSAEMTWLKADPVWESLRNDDRYWDLYERTGHKAYDDYRAGRNK